MNDKKAKIALNGFVEIAKKPKLQLNKLWVDQGRDFYNSLMQKWLDDIDILMYSNPIEDKSVIAQIVIKAL